MIPCKPNLTWDDVVEYAFLADFDLLRDSREDIRDRPWAKPACRVAMDQHFKQKRAAEEIVRLNVKIPRLITYMHDESRFLLHKEQEIAEQDPHLAHQIGCYRREQGRFHAMHMQHFAKLSRDPGFTGSMELGVSVDRSRHFTEDLQPGNALETIAEGLGSATPAVAVNTSQEDDDAEAEEEETGDLLNNLDALCIIGA